MNTTVELNINFCVNAWNVRDIFSLHSWECPRMRATIIPLYYTNQLFKWDQCRFGYRQKSHEAARLYQIRHLYLGGKFWKNWLQRKRHRCCRKLLHINFAVLISKSRPEWPTFTNLSQISMNYIWHVWQILLKICLSQCRYIFILHRSALLFVICSTFPALKELEKIEDYYSSYIKTRL